MVIPLIIFCFTYALIAARRLSFIPIGRSAGALLGATLMVFCGVITAEESFISINHDTILLLFGTMLLTVYLNEVKLFDLLSYYMLSLCKTPMQMLFLISIVTAIFSAFLVNDTACLFMTPVIVAICKKNKLPMGPYLICLATSANIGSAATIVGNPQNMIIGSYSQIGFGKFFLTMLPVVSASLIINMFLLYLFYRKIIPNTFPEERENENLEIAFSKSFYFTFVVLLFVITGFFSSLHLGYTAVAGCLVLIITQKKDPYKSFAKIDWPLLIMFCGLFIVTHGIAKAGLIENMWHLLGISSTFLHLDQIFYFVGFLTVGSQIISNVPMVLLTIPYLENVPLEVVWFYLAYVTTIAGNLTLLGSVANIIVAEIAKDDYDLKFWEYFKFGALSTIILIPIGTLFIYILFL